MRYYCIANPIPLIKTIASDNFIDNLPLVGTTIYGKLPVTDNKIQAIFFKSEHLVVCRTLDEAMILRQLKIEKKTNLKPDFFNKVANYPVADYAIYEIEVDRQIKVDFVSLVNLPLKQLYEVVSHDLYIKALYSRDTLELPDIDVCYDKKTAFSPQLIDFHYFHLNGFKEEDSTCSLF
jgi:hypothetical protein